METDPSKQPITSSAIAIIFAGYFGSFILINVFYIVLMFSYRKGSDP